MALTNAATANDTTSTCLWAGADYQSTDETGATYTDSYGSFTYQAQDSLSFIQNKDGYSETQAIANTYSSSLETTHPAFYYALNYAASGTYYAAPSGSSGWYLPSIGQWFDITINLGGMSTTPTLYKSIIIRWYNWDTGSTTNYSQIWISNINNYLTLVTTYNTPDLFSNEQMSNINNKTWSGEVYWSTSTIDVTPETSATGIRIAYLQSYYGLVVLRTYLKTNDLRVRCCIAF